MRKRRIPPQPIATPATTPARAPVVRPRLMCGQGRGVRDFFGGGRRGRQVLGDLLWWEGLPVLLVRLRGVEEIRYTVMSHALAHTVKVFF